MIRQFGRDTILPMLTEVPFRIIFRKWNKSVVDAREIIKIDHENALYFILLLQQWALLFDQTQILILTSNLKQRNKRKLFKFSLKLTYFKIGSNVNSHNKHTVHPIRIESYETLSFYLFDSNAFLYTTFNDVFRVIF